METISALAFPFVIALGMWIGYNYASKKIDK